MSYAHWVELLCCLGKVGILEQGYVNASLERGYTSVRLPWVKKDIARTQEEKIAFRKEWDARVDEGNKSNG
jgi:hypothetical protein